MKPRAALALRNVIEKLVSCSRQRLIGYLHGSTTAHLRYNKATELHRASHGALVAEVAWSITDGFKRIPLEFEIDDVVFARYVPTLDELRGGVAAKCFLSETLDLLESGADLDRDAFIRDIRRILKIKKHGTET